MQAAMTATPDITHQQRLSQTSHYLQVAQAIRYLAARRQEQPTLEELAAAVGCSSAHLQRLFSSWAGVSPKRFLQSLTRRDAIVALKESAGVLDASLAAGLSGPGRLHDLTLSCDALTPGEIASGGEGLTIRHGWAQSPFGAMLLGWTKRGICHLAFHDQEDQRGVEALRCEWPGAAQKEDPAGAAALGRQIFPTAPRPGQLHLLLRGTNFQIKVWEALLRVPEGSLVSYGQLAAGAGNPRAARAVGSAVASNRIALLIPCHRVIRESGEFGNYRWGPERKLAMHGWESARSANAPSG